MITLSNKFNFIIHTLVSMCRKENRVMKVTTQNFYLKSHISVSLTNMAEANRMAECLSRNMIPNCKALGISWPEEQ